MSKHTCHARGCSVPVHPRLLMCRAHWFQVPLPLRRAVLAAYVPGQEVTKDPTPEWDDAAKAAISAVAALEGRG